MRKEPPVVDGKLDDWSGADWADVDKSGVAANFIVTWAGAGPIAEPLVEAVMIGSQDNTSYSFVSPGRPIRHVGRSAWPSRRASMGWKLTSTHAWTLSIRA